MRGRTEAGHHEALQMQALARRAAPSLHCGLNGLRFTLISRLLSIISAFTLNDPHQAKPQEQNLCAGHNMHTRDQENNSKIKEMILFAFPPEHRVPAAAIDEHFKTAASVHSNSQTSLFKCQCSFSPALAMRRLPTRN